jgi:hypothetical protein
MKRSSIEGIVFANKCRVGFTEGLYESMILQKVETRIGEYIVDCNLVRSRFEVPARMQIHASNYICTRVCCSRMICKRGIG